MPIRRFEKGDVPRLTDIVRATNVFRPEEVAVAVELMDISADGSNDEDYVLFTYVDDGGTVQGYYCVGPTPMTTSTFDLYWIAVEPGVQGKGIGHELLTHCERYVKDHGGTLIMVETSSQPKYDGTNKFYRNHRYEQSARVKDYYGPADDLIVYSKHV